jgi:SAM-dependent methyltransferase
VLDFGCGAGRTLRHFLGRADKAEFWGCDIDEPSIAWIRQHLSPPLRVFSNAPAPPLEVADGSFDLVYVISVFTHLVDFWAEWLLELHRVLAPDGLLLVTFMGEGAMAWVTDEPWVEERIGIHVMSYGQSWDDGGPMVAHSPWWIRAHFQRAFEIVELRPTGFGSLPGEGHGSVLMRKRGQACTADALRAPEPDEPREAIALEHNRRQLFTEIASLRVQQEELVRELDDAREPARQSEAARLSSEHWVNAIASSRSWRLTAPLRRIAERLHRTTT